MNSSTATAFDYPDGDVKNCMDSGGGAGRSPPSALDCDNDDDDDGAGPMMQGVTAPLSPASSPSLFEPLAAGPSPLLPPR